MTLSPTSDFFITDEEFRRNAPSSPDRFRPHGPHLGMKYRWTKIVRTWSKATRSYAMVPWVSSWTFGSTEDGQLIGERWSKRADRWGTPVACVIDTRTFSCEEELKSYLLDQHRLHWQVQQKQRPARPVRVCA